MEIHLDSSSCRIEKVPTTIRTPNKLQNYLFLFTEIRSGGFWESWGLSAHMLFIIKKKKKNFKMKRKLIEQVIIGKNHVKQQKKISLKRLDVVCQGSSENMQSIWSFNTLHELNSWYVGASRKRYWGYQAHHKLYKWT